MSAWHREHPELAGTPDDPWWIHEDYRRAFGETRDPEPPEADEPEPVEE